MSLRSLLYIILLISLLTITTLLNAIGSIGLLQFQFILAVIIYINYRSYLTLLLLTLMFLLVDATLQVNIAFSFLCFAVAGLAVSLANQVYPLLRQRPFWLARLVWVGLSVVGYKLLITAGGLGVGILIAVVVNWLVLLLITSLIEPALAHSRTLEITIE